jgi:hypothetical protein
MSTTELPLLEVNKALQANKPANVASSPLPQTSPKKIMSLLSQKLVHWAGTRRKGNEKFFIAAVDQLPGRNGQVRHYRH